MLKGNQFNSSTNFQVYMIEAAAVNDGGTVSILNQSIATIYQQDVNYEVELNTWSATDTGLTIRVRSTSDTGINTRWVAKMQLASVLYA